MSELSTSETGFTDNAHFQHQVDTQGNIQGNTQGNLTGENKVPVKKQETEPETDSEMTTSEDNTTGLSLSPLSPSPEQQ